jgi:alkaline phosphatase D
MEIEWSTAADFSGARRVAGPLALAETDFTARVDLRGLPPGADVFYRVVFRDAREDSIASAPASGRFRTPPRAARTVRFSFAGDEVGQGWGIDRDWGGLRLYETMRRTSPDFFVHFGDQIYADGPLATSVALDDGGRWTNVVTPEKAVVAESLQEFRGNFAYNLLDENKRRFASEVPFLVQWDDHEVRNNWFPGQRVPGRSPGTSLDAGLLAARARRAVLEYCPFRLAPGAFPLYRSIAYGPSLDVFMLDARSHRGPNGPNREPEPGPRTALLGQAQLAWLERGLLASRATWKVIASDLPLSLVVEDPRPSERGYEAWSNGEPGAPLGREHEIARLLGFLQRHAIRNVVWVTADVHYACAIHHDPSRGAVGAFPAFWEFVAGPIHAGTFPPGKLDPTFGPELRFLSVPRDLKPNRPPSAGLQFFGLAEIDGRTAELAVSLRNLAGSRLFEVRLPPEP